MTAKPERGHRMFIYCDDASHPRRIAVTNFVFRDPGWGEQYTRRNGKDHGITLGPDGPRPPGEDAARWVRSVPTRYRYDLPCRKCERPVQLREEVLWRALDAAALQGARELSLTGLAAIVARQSKERGVDPELGQG